MIALDDCRNEPWTGRHLSSLPDHFCHSTIDSTVVHLVDVDVRPGIESLNVTFHLLDGAAKASSAIKWAISLRRFGAVASPEDAWAGELPIGVIGGAGQIKVIDGLLPSTGYEVCVQLPSTPGSAHCWEVVTQPATTPPYPVAEVAVAASAASTSTFIVVLLVCCYCPRLKRHRRNNKKKTTAKASSEKSPIFAISSGSDGAPLWLDGPQSSGDDSPVRNLTTFRTEGGGGKAEEESRKAFQATCSYLKQRAMDPGRPAQQGPAAQPHYLKPLGSAVYFNNSYGLMVSPPSATDPATTGPYKYCTWRPQRVQQVPGPALQRCTSYPDFLANPSSSLYFQPHHVQRPGAVALPVYSMTAPGPRYKRARFYWSAAPAVEFQF